MVRVGWTSGYGCRRCLRDGLDSDRFLVRRRRREAEVGVHLGDTRGEVWDVGRGKDLT